MCNIYNFVTNVCMKDYVVSGKVQLCLTEIR
jgi:hypothetical protein